MTSSLNVHCYIKQASSGPGWLGRSSSHQKIEPLDLRGDISKGLKNPPSAVPYSFRFRFASPMLRPKNSPDALNGTVTPMLGPQRFFRSVGRLVRVSSRLSRLNRSPELAPGFTVRQSY